MRDQIFRVPLDPIESFQFTAAVADAFDDMAMRSIPFYPEVQRLTALLFRSQGLGQGTLYDLGCATGNTVLALLELLSPEQRILAVDTSPRMLDLAREKIRGAAHADQVTFLCEDVLDVEIEDAAFVVANYTVQFLPPEERFSLFRRIFRGLRPGGIFLVSEKTREKDPDLSGVYTGEYHAMKYRNGYSRLEIEQKAIALKDALVPMTCDENLALFRQAGFRDVSVLFKWLDFATFVAVRH